jgi:tetratricopeptide (TPR) repeat protein
MKKALTLIALTLCGLLAGAAPQSAAQSQPQPPLSRLVKKIQPAVATVIAYDIERNITNLGTGFFINKKGHLLTNHHVLRGRYAADVKTADGKSYRVKSVLAENRPADLLKLEVDIPPDEVEWIQVSERLPEIAERIVVVGSPMGLEQTVSEGIVSSIRDIPPVGTVFQMSAPISPGSSGSPVVNLKGQVVGIATFQFLQGQNLNFAVAARQIMALNHFESAKSVSEWAFAASGSKPRVAEELCQKGFSFSINGEDQKALEFFKMATEKDPDDPGAWSGLGSCYAGLNNPEDAVAAYQQAIQANPRDEAGYFHLANYLGKLGRYEEAIATYREAIRIKPGFEAAHFNLGVALSRLERYEEGKSAFETVTQLNPEAAPAFYNMGIALGLLGRHQEAIASQKRVIILTPNFAPAYFAIGESLTKLDRSTEAVQAYTESIRVDPEFAPAHLGLGLARVKQGKKASALEEYKILMKLDENLARNLFQRIYPEDEPEAKPKRNPKQPKP